MKNKKLLLIPAIIIPILAIGIFALNRNTSASETIAKPIIQDTLETENIDITYNDINREEEFVVPPIVGEKTETAPQTHVVTDAKGNQVITPNVIVQNPNGITPKPGTETPKVESKPVETPAPTEQPKTEDKPTTNKPASNAAKDGDRRVANGQKEIFLEGFGWLEDAPGGSSITGENSGTGEIIGH